MTTSYPDAAIAAELAEIRAYRAQLAAIAAAQELVFPQHRRPPAREWDVCQWGGVTPRRLPDYPRPETQGRFSFPGEGCRAALHARAPTPTVPQDLPSRLDRPPQPSVIIVVLMSPSGEISFPEIARHQEGLYADL